MKNSKLHIIFVRKLFMKIKLYFGRGAKIAVYIDETT